MNTTLLLGDCAEQMRTLADNSIDAIVTDPPYGLNFMGMDFDNPKMMGQSPVMHGGLQRYNKGEKRTGYADCDNAKFQSYLTPIFAEALRIAKPGAHLLAFGGTRTYHRLACAIEDAGWEIRDCIMWVYGCLSEDTEILTCKGWAKIGTIQIGDRIHAYDRKTKTFRYEAVKDTFLYDYDDTAYRIQSDSTDQLVSRNHRVIVERSGVEVFEYAENLAQEHEASVPILESLQGLLDYISMLDKRAGSSQQNLFTGMRSGIAAQGTTPTLGRPFTEQDMSCMREGVLRPFCMAEKSKDELLFGKLQEQGRECSSSNKTQQGTPYSDYRRTEKEIARVYDGRDESSMERRSDMPTPQGKLCECSVCALPEEISANGSEGRICNGASSCGCESDWSAPGANGSCASHQSQPVRQSSGESNALSEQFPSQIFRDAWRTTTSLARITPVHYKGRMWCVSVPSGAIVARRNGKIFVTGNSGFPKSMDVSKAIDKMKGGERTEVLGYKNQPDMRGGALMETQGKPRLDIPVTAPATPEAAAWNGWGTCLKPAVEPIVVARKPLDGTVAANVLKYGTGAINIDGCRVQYESDADKESMHFGRPNTSKIGAFGGKTQNNNPRNVFYPKEAQGRFPANLIHDGSPEVLALFPDSKGQCGAVKGTEPSRTGTNGIYGNYNGQNTMSPRGDTGSAARFFYCAKASRYERGSFNDHCTVKPLALMRYLVRLVTRKGGIVLDPFMGSGTTGVAAIEEGMNFVGIERDPHYYEIASRRIAAAKPEPPTPTQQELPL